MEMASSLSLGAAFVAGIASSGHCVSMCGGIAGALAMRDRDATAGARLVSALTYNLGRTASYTVAGAIAGLVGGALLHAIDVALLSLVFRVLSGLIMLAAAGRLLFGWRLLDPIESSGARLWARIAPWARGQARSGGIRGAAGLGFAWGWLPCGLTYSMLLLAATSGSALIGAAVMLAFGAGTLPSMVTAGVAFDRAARVLSAHGSLKRVAGLLLLAFGLWTAGWAVAHVLGRGAGHEHHIMPAGSTQEGAPGSMPADHQHHQ